MINNVLEEIKRLKNQRVNAQSDLKHLCIHPSHFSSTIDTKAKRTVNNIGNIYGTSEKDREYLRVGESNYKNNLFTGHRTDFDSTVRSAGKSGIDHSDYVNKFMGIPKNVKILNNDNTLYYEKKLGKKTEFDFAIDNMTTDLDDKQAGFNSLISSIRSKKPSLIKQSVASEVAAAKAVKTQIKNPKISSTPPTNVTVSPAFSTPLPDDEKDVVSPKKGEEEDKIQKANVSEAAEFQHYDKTYNKQSLRQFAENFNIYLNMKDKKDDMITDLMKQLKSKKKMPVGDLKPLGNQI